MDNEAVETPRPVLTRDVMRQYSLCYGVLALCLTGISCLVQHDTLDEKSCIRIGLALIQTSGTLSFFTVLPLFADVLYALEYQSRSLEAETRSFFSNACWRLLYAVLVYLPSVFFLLVGTVKKGKMEIEIARQLLEFVTLSYYAYWHWMKGGYTLLEYLNTVPDGI